MGYPAGLLRYRNSRVHVLLLLANDLGIVAEKLPALLSTVQAIGHPSAGTARMTGIVSGSFRSIA